MPRISREEINEIRNKADIVNVVGHYIQLERKGKEYLGRCPFHDDHSPSMHVSPEMQIYKCFVCNNGGDVFTFVQNFEKVPFVEAVGKVADIVGIPLTVDQTAYEKPKDTRKEKLYKVLNETINFTTYQLESRDFEVQRNYLEKRGLDAETRKFFQIGYNPGGDRLYNFLHAKGYPDSDMTEVNVVRLTDSGIHDVFYDRITFPIHDEYGNPIGFSARTLDSSNPSKYINTNETALFKKGHLVYNSHRAKLAARRAGKVYVCEGVTDVIAFHRAGFDNAVCTLGTACTEEQLKLMRGMALKIVFCYDGDNPGQAATWKAAKAAVTAGCDVGIVLNRTKKDPDEIIREQGAAGLENLLKNELSWIEFVIEYLSSRTNMNSYTEKKEFVQKVQVEIAGLRDEMDRKYFTEKLSEMTGFHLDYTSGPRTEREVIMRRVSVPRGSMKAEEQILKMMIDSPAAVHRFETMLGFLNYPLHQTLAMMIVDAVHASGKADPLQLIGEAETQEMKDLITKLVASEEYRKEYDEAAFDGAVRKVKITVLETEADAYKEQLTMQMNPEARELIFNKYGSCLRELRRYIDEENYNGKN